MELDAGKKKQVHEEGTLCGALTAGPILHLERPCRRGARGPHNSHCETLRTLTWCWWGQEVALMLRETSRQFLKWLKVELPRDAASPLRGVLPSENTPALTCACERPRQHHSQ